MGPIHTLEFRNKSYFTPSAFVNFHHGYQGCLFIWHRAWNFFFMLQHSFYDKFLVNLFSLHRTMVILVLGTGFNVRKKPLLIVSCLNSLYITNYKSWIYTITDGSVGGIPLVFNYLGLFQSYNRIYLETDKYCLVIPYMKTYKGELQTYTFITLLYIEGSV